jgi:hypothetical protein
MPRKSSLFDFFESERRKRLGMKDAAENETRVDDLDFARNVARCLARQNPDRECYADQVGEILDQEGIELGPSSGSIFKGSEWEFTGKRIKSSRKSNHARELKVWRLK